MASSNAGMASPAPSLKTNWLSVFCVLSIRFAWYPLVYCSGRRRQSLPPPPASLRHCAALTPTQSTTTVLPATGAGPAPTRMSRIFRPDALVRNALSPACSDELLSLHASHSGSAPAAPGRPAAATSAVVSAIARRPTGTGSWTGAGSARPPAAQAEGPRPRGRLRARRAEIAAEVIGNVW